MWHVSSRSGVAPLRTAMHLLLTYLRVYSNETDDSGQTRANNPTGIHAFRARVQLCEQALNFARTRGTGPSDRLSDSATAVLFFSRPRSEGLPHHGRRPTFPIYLCYAARLS